MARPDLSTPEGRAAYSQELRRVAIEWRVSGIVLLAVGGFTLARTLGAGSALTSGSGLAGIAIIALGVAVSATAIAKRTAYHRRRMAEEA